MKRMILMLTAVLPLVSFGQSVTVTRSLEMLPNSQAVVQFNNIFGNWENREVDDSFPYVVIQMNLAGDANAVSMAKQKIGLEVGTMFQVTATDKNQPNKILFLVPRGVRNIYVVCGDGCEKQLLHSGTLVENKVYECTVQYTAAVVSSGANNDALAEQMAAMQKRMEEMEKQNEQMQKALQNSQDGGNSIGNAGVNNENLKTTNYPGVVVENGVLQQVPEDFVGDFVIGDDVIDIANIAFRVCSGLKSVKLSNSVKKIGVASFIGCTGLTSLTIPGNVNSIGNSAFSGCTSLSSVAIPNSVYSIGESAFSNCKSLKSVTIPKSVTKIEMGTFFECSALTSVTIPNGVRSIKLSAFEKCTSLTDVFIPNSVTEISWSVFAECTNLNSVTIPGSVISIGRKAFYKCSGLTTVIFEGPNTELDTKQVFLDCNNLNTIYVPKGSRSFYESQLPKELRKIIVEK